MIHIFNVYQLNNKILFSSLIITTLITWNIFYVIIPNTTYWIDPLMVDTSLENKIHIVIIFDGDQGLQYLNSLLKSIFYYQNGRFRCDLKACCLSNFCDRFIDDCHTVMNSGSTTYTTVFHFLITTISSNSQLLNLMNTWKLHNMEYHFYSCSDYLVIVLDIDILLNTDIIELWNHFEYFKETQYIINLVLFEFNYILHEIPCEWNIQLSGGSDEQRCPVSWLTYNELKKRNYTTNFKQPKLIHINHHIKPDDVKVNDTPTEYIDQSDIILKRLQYLNSLLKSIFYYQNGRFRCDLKACCLSNFCDRFIDDCHTVMNSGSTTYTTVFHFLITTIASNSQLLNLMNTWKLHNMEYHFYSCSDYLVIVLDIDILLNTDIIELWNHFEYFEETQYIINLVLFEFNCILHEIPCEWNIQLSGGSDEQRCPVSWLTYNELKKRNYTTNFKQPKLIHIIHHIKPDDVKVNDTPTEYIDQSDITLKRLQYLNSLLKSIFYYQNGRFRCDLKACCLSNFCDRFIDDCHTVMNSGSTTYTTVFHFLITTISSNSQLLNLMNTWKLHDMEYHFYSCSDYLVIVLDIDILLNTDIIELWNHFEYFKETQVCFLIIIVHIIID
ncbi:unnamed protein product [Schistosoma spindalis]|nr:unnamed protein product [Schistosoma spindale]